MRELARLSGEYSLPLAEAARRVISRLLEEGLDVEVSVEAPGVEVRLRALGESRVGAMVMERTGVRAEGDPEALEVVRRSLMLGGG